METMVIDFGVQAEKGILFHALRALTGKWTIVIKRFSKRISKEQRGYYHAVFCPAFAEWLQDQGEPCDADRAHELFKLYCNPKTIVSSITGEAKTIGGTTTTLGMAGMNAFMDRCAALLANYCGVPVPPPTTYHFTAADWDGPPDAADMPTGARHERTMQACREAVKNKG